MLQSYKGDWGHWCMFFFVEWIKNGLTTDVGSNPLRNREPHKLTCARFEVFLQQYRTCIQSLLGTVGSDASLNLWWKCHGNSFHDFSISNCFDIWSSKYTSFNFGQWIHYLAPLYGYIYIAFCWKKSTSLCVTHRRVLQISYSYNGRRMLQIMHFMLISVHANQVMNFTKDKFRHKFSNKKK